MALWCSAVVIIFGVSFQELSDLQGPLASLNVAAHVMYRVARLRSQLSLLAFELNATVTETYRAEALSELGLLRGEYETLLYGGRVLTLVSIGGGTMGGGSILISLQGLADVTPMHTWPSYEVFPLLGSHA